MPKQRPNLGRERQKEGHPCRFREEKVAPEDQALARLNSLGVHPHAEEIEACVSSLEALTNEQTGTVLIRRQKIDCVATFLSRSEAYTIYEDFQRIVQRVANILVSAIEYFEKIDMHLFISEKEKFFSAIPSLLKAIHIMRVELHPSSQVDTCLARTLKILIGLMNHSDELKRVMLDALTDRDFLSDLAFELACARDFGETDILVQYFLFLSQLVSFDPAIVLSFITDHGLFEALNGFLSDKDFFEAGITGMAFLISMLRSGNEACARFALSQLSDTESYESFCTRFQALIKEVKYDHALNQLILSVIPTLIKILDSLLGERSQEIENSLKSIVENLLKHIAKEMPRPIGSFSWSLWGEKSRHCVSDRREDTTLGTLSESAHPSV